MNEQEAQAFRSEIDTLQAIPLNVQHEFADGVRNIKTFVKELGENILTAFGLQGHYAANFQRLEQMIENKKYYLMRGVKR